MRPQAKNRLPATVHNVVFSGLYGSVRVYTRRHINACLLQDDNQQNCGCPKWMYVSPRGAAPYRKSAGTGDFTEACDEARKVLKGFDPVDPEVQELRKLKGGSSIAVEDAIERYLTMLASRDRAPNYLVCVAGIFRRRRKRPAGLGPGRKALNVSLLDFLDAMNRTARVQVSSVDQITSDMLDAWQATWRTNDLTSKIWRRNIKSFLTWILGRGHIRQLPVFDKGASLVQGNRCGYFTDEEYDRIVKALPFYKAPGLKNYAARLGAFIELGRWAGMAVTDIVHFRPAHHLAPNDVLTYRRHKNRRKNVKPAVILLDPVRAARFRSIPPEEGSDPDQPFRFLGVKEALNCAIWRDRFQKLCAFAGMREIETEAGTRRKPHPHMLRDTFAIDAITRGVELHNIAKMLGHAKTATTENAYLFWTQQRLDDCVESQRRALARVKSVETAGAADSVANGDGLGSPFVH